MLPNTNFGPSLRAIFRVGGPKQLIVVCILSQIQVSMDKFNSEITCIDSVEINFRVKTVIICSAKHCAGIVSRTINI